jgi:predicted N-acetyltransferase YhbS
MKFRIAQPRDATAIAALHATSWRNTYRGVLSDEYLDQDVESEWMAIWEDRFRNPKANQHIIVAENGPQIVGFAIVYGDEDDQWGTLLASLHVSPAHKGQGIGSKLTANVAAWCSKTCQTRGLYLWAVVRGSFC